MARDIWPRSTLGKVVAGLLIAVMALPAAWLLGPWSLLAGWLDEIWGFLAGSTLVPNWALSLLVLCALIVAGLFGAALAPRRDSADPESEE
jgi:hypothetical protein